MPLFNRRARLCNLAINVEGGPNNFCPGAVVQGTMTFDTSMPDTVMKTIRMELIGILEIQNHKGEIMRRERLVHYVTHYTKPVLAEVDTSCVDVEPSGSCCVASCDNECCTSSSDEEGQRPTPVTAATVTTPNAGSCVLPAGSHSFPFSFLIPQDALATFSVQLPFNGPSFLAYTLVAVAQPRQNLLPVFHKVPLQVLSVAPEYQLVAESLPGTAVVTAPLSGFFTNNGAAEVVATVSTTMMCLSAPPPPIIVSLQVDNFGGKKPITRVEASLIMILSYSTRHGLNLTATAEVGKVLLNGNTIPAGGKGSFGGHLTFDESKRTLAIPTFQTSFTAVNWYVSLEIKEAKKPIRMPITVVALSDSTNTVLWNHHEKPRTSLSEGQYYEVAPCPVFGGEPVMGSVVA